MKMALIDDEADARATLRSLISNHLPSVEFREADGISSGLSLIHQYQPEVVFLDVMMKDGTGFDLLKQLVFRRSVIHIHHRDNFAVLLSSARQSL